MTQRTDKQVAADAARFNATYHQLQAELRARGIRNVHTSPKARKLIEVAATVPLTDRAIAAEGVRLMLLMRLSGFPPFTWINYALSLSGVRFLPYLLTTFFGIIPGVLAFTWAGAAGAKALSGEGNRIALIVTAVGAVLVSAYIARIAARAVRRAH